MNPWYHGQQVPHCPSLSCALADYGSDSTTDRTVVRAMQRACRIGIVVVVVGPDRARLSQHQHARANGHATPSPAHGSGALGGTTRTLHARPPPRTPLDGEREQAAAAACVTLPEHHTSASSEDGTVLLDCPLRDLARDGVGAGDRYAAALPVCARQCPRCPAVCC